MTFYNLDFLTHPTLFLVVKNFLFGLVYNLKLTHPLKNQTSFMNDPKLKNYFKKIEST